ncbi:MAG TPA: hypothetical protein VKZ41_13630 [Gemmatimonadales bacterium]|nr:hypothetical protein [Gemmatimonadales bacterium]
MSHAFEPPRENAEPADTRDTLKLDEPLLLFLTSAVEQRDDPLADADMHREFVDATVRYARAVERYMSNPQVRSRFHDRTSRLFNVLGQYVTAQALQPPSGVRPPETAAIFQIAARVREFALAHERQRLLEELPLHRDAIVEEFGIFPERWRDD